MMRPRPQSRQKILTVAGCLLAGMAAATIILAQWRSLGAILCASGVIALSALIAPLAVILVIRHTEPPTGRHWAKVKR